METLLICLLILSTLVMLTNIYVVYLIFSSQRLNRQVTEMNDVIMTIGELNTSKQFRIKDLKDNTYRGWQIHTLIEERKNGVLELQLLI